MAENKRQSCAVHSLVHQRASMRTTEWENSIWAMASSLTRFRFSKRRFRSIREILRMNWNLRRHARTWVTYRRLACMFNTFSRLERAGQPIVSRGSLTKNLEIHWERYMNLSAQLVSTQVKKIISIGVL